MPTVLRADGLRIVIYRNDRPPARVHVIGQGWAVVINLLGPQLREVLGCGEREARRAVDLVAEHQEALLDAWRRIHG